MCHETIQRESVIEKKWEKVDEMCFSITEIEKILQNMHKKLHSDMQKNQNNSSAMYGLLKKHNDVTKKVNELYEMNLRNMRCILANCTHYRHDTKRPGMVITELRCQEEKREILKRKRFIRTHPVYHNVFIKSIIMGTWNK